MDGSGRWLARLSRVSDFAGSTLVHVGGSAPAGVILLGPRLGRFSDTGEPTNMTPFAPSSIPLVTLGLYFMDGLVWF